MPCILRQKSRRSLHFENKLAIFESKDLGHSRRPEPKRRHLRCLRGHLCRPLAAGPPPEPPAPAQERPRDPKRQATPQGGSHRAASPPLIPRASPTAAGPTGWPQPRAGPSAPRRQPCPRPAPLTGLHPPAVTILLAPTRRHNTAAPRGALGAAVPPPAGSAPPPRPRDYRYQQPPRAERRAEQAGRRHWLQRALARC